MQSWTPHTAKDSSSSHEVTGRRAVRTKHSRAQSSEVRFETCKTKKDEERVESGGSRVAFMETLVQDMKIVSLRLGDPDGRESGTSFGLRTGRKGG